MTNYIDELAKEIFRNCKGEGWGNSGLPSYDEEDKVLYLAYALLLLAKGDAVTDEDVHNAWAVWASVQAPEHRSLVPFEQLPSHIQNYDKPYTAAIHAVYHARIGKMALS